LGERGTERLMCWALLMELASKLNQCSKLYAKLNKSAQLSENFKHWLKKNVYGLYTLATCPTPDEIALINPSNIWTFQCLFLLSVYCFVLTVVSEFSCVILSACSIHLGLSAKNYRLCYYSAYLI
jgi:hypothetical protein